MEGKYFRNFAQVFEQKKNTETKVTTGQMTRDSKTYIITGKPRKRNKSRHKKRISQMNNRNA